MRACLLVNGIQVRTPPPAPARLGRDARTRYAGPMSAVKPTPVPTAVPTPVPDERSAAGGSERPGRAAIVDESAPVQPGEDLRPLAPREPQLEDCCGTGCVNCVFNMYEIALANYERALTEWEARQAAPSDAPSAA